MNMNEKALVALLDAMKRRCAGFPLEYEHETAVIEMAQNAIESKLDAGQVGEATKEAETFFDIGDIVSRDGTDEHLVFMAGGPGENIGVICIKEPQGDLHQDGVTRDEPWTEFGETEYNLANRYSLVRKARYTDAVQQPQAPVVNKGCAKPYGEPEFYNQGVEWRPVCGVNGLCPECLVKYGITKAPAVEVSGELRWQLIGKHEIYHTEGNEKAFVPFLEHSVGPACFEVYDADYGWNATFWHGNAGHHVARLVKTSSDAKGACQKHFDALRSALLVTQPHALAIKVPSWYKDAASVATEGWNAKTALAMCDWVDSITKGAHP